MKLYLFSFSVNNPFYPCYNMQNVNKYVFKNEGSRQCLKLKKNPGIPVSKAKATKPVNFAALINPWLPFRKTPMIKCMPCLRCNHMAVKLEYLSVHLRFFEEVWV